MKLRIILILTLIANFGFAQNFHEKFKKSTEEKDTIQQLKILKEWESKNSNDPELYTSYFNYYFAKSKTDLISIDKNSNGKEGYQLKDSLGNVAGYIQSNKSYNEKYAKKGIEYIDKGILKFPKRLDMRFGKTYVLGENENYTEFTKEIIKTIEYSNVIKNEWNWTKDKKLEDAENFMLGSIQNYVTQLYNTGNDDLLENMKNIAETILKYYPNHIESLSNISIVHLIRKEFDKGLEYLQKAEKINPTDFVVLGNIAQAYKMKDDKINAIKYYELVKKYGNEDAKANSDENIKNLRK
ncbi:tetratricopeptide repeat protein [Flavobacterium sp.]|jgi:tetratricopeptide (TPR) repeat protein|uniref:tetratricopeptide repeat protein n=1 Tax=Flavobacterium sp. TaxID=239 RepID=UPI0037C143DE